MPTSFSQSSMFEKCPRCWYLTYIKKIPVVQDLMYANAGKVTHEVLQEYYDRKITVMDDIKEFFKRRWLYYKLDETKLKFNESEYWLMVVEGINLNLQITSTELKIFFDDVVGYLDALNSSEDIVHDWKSSNRRQENEEEYSKQMLFYAYLYNRKFNRIPKQLVVHYLRHTGSKSTLVIKPTIDDVNKIEIWHKDIIIKMQEVRDNNKEPERCKECHMFCPFTNLCCDDGELDFKIITIGNNLYLEGPISDLLHKGLEKKFSYELKNAYWIKRKYPTANTTVRFWNQHKRMLPIGFRQGLLKTLTDYAEHKKLKLNITFEDTRVINKEVVPMPDKFVNGVVLRDYQIDAMRTFMRNGIGILEIGTGGGKTELAIEIIRQLKCRTLFMCDKVELLRQTKKRIEEALGIEVGQIGAGVEEIKPITVATIQTLVKHIAKYKEYLASINLAIFDETHHVAAKSYTKVSKYLIGTTYRLGVSATAERDDGNSMMITAVTGYIVKDLGSKVLIDNGWLVRPMITFIKDYMPEELIKDWEHECKGDLINPTKDYNKYYERFIMNNTYRNNKIVEIVNSNKGKKILILTKLIEHGRMLNSLIPNSKHLYGDTEKEEREKMFNDFVNGNDNILISTISIWSEGLDCKSLFLIINAGANSGDVKTIQMLGRTLRISEGKTYSKYIDFIDETRFFRSASLKRKRILKKEGHNVEIIN